MMISEQRLEYPTILRKVEKLSDDSYQQLEYLTFVGEKEHVSDDSLQRSEYLTCVGERISKAIFSHGYEQLTWLGE